jgi:spore germination cell wall hydrolase CwlJ-like protein
VIVAITVMIITPPERENDSAPEPEEMQTNERETAETAPPPATSPTTIIMYTPEPPAEPEPISRYADIPISGADVEELARLVWHEARGECFEGQVAVIEVVLNRCLSEEFPDTVSEVIHQKAGDRFQFSPAPYLDTATPGVEQYVAVHTAINSTEYVLTVETVFFSTTPYNEHISAVIGNHYFCTIY